jgi:hypothetical protein
VRNPDDGKLPGALASAVLGKRRDQALGVHVDEVVAGTRRCFGVGDDVGIVSIDQNVGVLALQRCRQQVSGPVDAVLGCPGPYGVSVEAVDEYDVSFCLWVAVYRCNLKASYGFVDGPLDVRLCQSTVLFKPSLV